MRNRTNYNSGRFLVGIIPTNQKGFSLVVSASKRSVSCPQDSTPPLLPFLPLSVSFLFHLSSCFCFLSPLFSFFLLIHSLEHQQKVGDAEFLCRKILYLSLPFLPPSDRHKQTVFFVTVSVNPSPLCFTAGMTCLFLSAAFGFLRHGSVHHAPKSLLWFNLFIGNIPSSLFLDPDASLLI